MCALVSFISGTISGAVGAGGVIIVPSLVLCGVPPLAAVTAVLASYIPIDSAMVAIFVARKKLSLVDALPLWLGVAPGALIGIALLPHVPATVVSIVVSIAASSAGVVSIIKSIAACVGRGRVEHDAGVSSTHESQHECVEEYCACGAKIIRDGAMVYSHADGSGIGAFDGLCFAR